MLFRVLHPFINALCSISALASRCLQLVVHYVPRVKAHFDAALPAKNHSMLKHFDKIVKDYQDHIEEISNKLVNIAENSLEGPLGKV